MKKSQLLTAMGLLTGLGIAMVVAGLLNLSQFSDYTLSQAWTELWDQHTVFAWVACIYCSIILACDFWVMAGILYQSPQKKLAD